MRWKNKNTRRWPILLAISVPKIFVNGQFYFNLSSKTWSHVFFGTQCSWRTRTTCGYVIGAGAYAHTKDRPDFLMLAYLFWNCNFYTEVYIFVYACFLNGHFRFVFLSNLHYTDLLMIMTKAHNILSKVNNMNSIEQFLAHSLIMVLNVS